MTMKKFLAAFLSAAMAVTSAAIPVFADEADEAVPQDDGIELAAKVTPTPHPEWVEENEKGTPDGSQDHPYTIKSVEGLKALSDNMSDYKENSFELTADIDLNGSEENPWTPISTSGSRFKGQFDGAGHTIRGLYINSPSESYQGLFGYLGSSPAGEENIVIENLTVQGSVTGGDDVAGVVGHIASSSVTVRNCRNECTVTGKTKVGGVVGYTYSEAPIEDCSNIGNITGDNYTGGIVGQGYNTTVTHCINSGKVAGGNQGYIGGIAGSIGDGTVERCSNSGEIRSTNETTSCYALGGICGEAKKVTISACYNTGTVGDKGGRCGGIVGSVPSNSVNTITNCYNLGDITATANAGGISGYNNSSTITNAFSVGTIVSTNSSGGHGGIIGEGMDKNKLSNTYYMNCTRGYGYSDVNGQDKEGQVENIKQLSELQEKFEGIDAWYFEPDGTPQLTNNPRRMQRSLTISATKGGMVTVNNDTLTPMDGDTVELTVAPETAEGYKLAGLTATYGETKVPLTPEEISPEGGQYTFTMPAADVTVSASFIKEESVAIVDQPIMDEPKAEGIEVSPDVLNSFADWTADLSDTSDLDKIGDAVDENTNLQAEAVTKLEAKMEDDFNSDEEVYIHVVTDLAFTLTAYDAERNTFAVDISAVRHLIASPDAVLTEEQKTDPEHADRAVEIGDERPITVRKDITITIPVPAAFEAGKTVEINHTHGDANYTYYSKVNDGTVQFTAHGLSNFTLKLLTDEGEELPTAITFTNIGTETLGETGDIKPNETKKIEVASDVKDTTLTFGEGVEVTYGETKVNDGDPIQLNFGDNIFTISAGGKEYTVNIFREAPKKLSVYFVKKEKDNNREYDIVIKAPGDEVINRLNTVDLTFELTEAGSEAPISDSGVTYDITSADGIDLINAGGGRYEFHFEGKDGFDKTFADTDSEITLGTVKFMGYSSDELTFKVNDKLDPDTNIVHATTEIDNIVSDYVASPVEGDNRGTLEVNEDLKDDSGNYHGTITDTFGIETTPVTINVMFPNQVVTTTGDGADKPYKEMKMSVNVKGGSEIGEDGTVKPFERTINLGDTSDTVTTTNFDYGTQKVSAEGDANGYQITLDVPVPADTGSRLTFTFSGDGYRTYSVDGVVKAGSPFTVTVWNNVMDTEQVILTSDGSKDPTVSRKTFLAGDIVEDNDINLYDLSAVAAYFGKTNNMNTAEGSEIAIDDEYIQYDLNRDGQIDSKDIAMVLVSWNN